MEAVSENCLGKNYIKIGHLHSKKALEKRAKEWMEKWNEIPERSSLILRQLQDTSNSPLLSFHGFRPEECVESLAVYYMTQEQIINLEAEKSFTSDEEEEEEEEENKEVVPCRPIRISLKYSAEEDRFIPCISPADSVNNEDEPTKLSGDDIITSTVPEPSEKAPSESSSNEDEEDPDTVRSRPVSRICLLPLRNLSEFDTSDCESERPPSRLSQSGGYTSYFETECEEEDDFKIMIIGNFTSKKQKSKGVYGPIPGVNVGTIWNNRRQFSRRSVHRPQNAIIHGGPKGAYSMVLSATYSVVDRGEEFDFLGEGGRDPKTKKLVRDQVMHRGNLSLRDNIQSGTPVRIIRGYQLQNAYSPDRGYRYDGLYQVTQCSDQKIDGYRVFVFIFARCANQPLLPWHSVYMNMPSPSPSPTELRHESSSDSDDTPERQRLAKPKKKRKRRLVPETSRSSSSNSSINEDSSPPVLQLAKTGVQYLIYPEPPVLSPIYGVDIERKPVIRIEKLKEDLVAEVIIRPISATKVCLLNGSGKDIEPKSVQPEKTDNQCVPKKSVYKGKNSKSAKEMSNRKLKYSQNDAIKRFRNRLLKKKRFKKMKPMKTYISMKKKFMKAKSTLKNGSALKKSLMGKISMKKKVATKEVIKTQRGPRKKIIKNC